MRGLLVLNFYPYWSLVLLGIFGSRLVPTICSSLQMGNVYCRRRDQATNGNLHRLVAARLSRSDHGGPSTYFMDQGTRSCFSTHFCTMVDGSFQWWLGVELHLCAGLSRRVDYPASVPRPKQLHQEPLPPYMRYIQSLLVLVLLLLTRRYLNDLPLSCLPCNPKHLNDLQKWFLLLQALSKNWITWTLSKIPYPLTITPV